MSVHARSSSNSRKSQSLPANLHSPAFGPKPLSVVNRMRVGVDPVGMSKVTEPTSSSPGGIASMRAKEGPAPAMSHPHPSLPAVPA